MSTKPAEETELRHRLLKCTLEVEASRAFWLHSAPGTVVVANQAFNDFLFGARSLNRITELLTSLRARYAAFPESLEVLHAWPHMSPDTRRTICHWHLQLAEPLYRRYTGEFLPSRRAGHRAEVTHDLTVRWVADQSGARWAMSTCIQFASKLMSAAYSAGLLGKKVDPRPVITPRVADDALGYMMYLLREIDFEGTLLENPYLASVELIGPALLDRLRRLPGLSFSRQAQLVDFGWQAASLREWASATVHGRNMSALGAAA
jgi:hypothetical protein